MRLGRSCEGLPSLNLNTSTPGSGLPSIHSRNAPPAVETYVNSSGDARGVERRDGIAAARDRDKFAGLRQFGGSLRDRDGAGIERLHFERAERAVPDQRLRPAPAARRPVRRTSGRYPASCRLRRRGRHRRRARARWPRISAPRRHRPEARSCGPFCLALSMISRAVSSRSCSASDLPTALPCAARNVFAIAPPMIRTSTLSIRLPRRSSLVEIFAPPTMAATGRVRRIERLFQRLEFGLHAAARVGRQLVAKTFGRGVRAVRGGERVVDPDVAELCERRDKRRIVLFLALVKARVFKTQNVARLHGGDGCLARPRRCSRRRMRPAA